MRRIAIDLLIFLLYALSFSCIDRSLDNFFWAAIGVVLFEWAPWKGR